MTYKIVKNSLGEIVAFGPADENYEPAIKDGETLTIESGKDVENLIKEYQAKLLLG